MKQIDDNAPCPCSSAKTYRDCCSKYHRGEPPQDPLSLMRSRYSAYALGLASYIIQTTHPQNKRALPDLQKWTKEILEFTNSTEFQRLDILETTPKRPSDGVATVTFTAHLKQNGKDASFTEKSYFQQLNGRWLYLDGDILQGNR